MTYYDKHIKRRQEWLTGLKPGDTACIPGHGLTQGSYAEVVVKRVTPTGRIVVHYPDRPDYEMTFDKYGSKRDDRWNSSRLEELTEDLKESKRRTNMRRRVTQFDYRKLDDDGIQKVYDLLVTLPTRKE